MRTIKVTQNASEKLAPDSMVLEVSLRAENKKYADAVQLLHKKTDEITMLLAAAAITEKEITTRGASVSTVRRDGKTLYEAYSGLKLILSVEDQRIGNILDALERSGADWTCEFTLEKSFYRKALIQKAVRKAREAAESIAQAADVKLGKLANVEYAASFGGGVRMMRMAKASMADGGAPEPIEATETVTCEWEIAE